MKLKKIVPILTKKIGVSITKIEEIDRIIKKRIKRRSDWVSYDLGLGIKCKKSSQCPEALRIKIDKFSPEFSKRKVFVISRNFYNDNVNKSILINIELSVISFLVNLLPFFNTYFYDFVKVFNYKDKWKNKVILKKVNLKKVYVYKSGKEFLMEPFFLYFNFYFITPYMLILTMLTLTDFKKYKS